LVSSPGTRLKAEDGWKVVWEIWNLDEPTE
jgi:hypothetical protein